MARLFTFLRPSRAERELAREVDAHLALIEEAGRRRGLTPDEARFAAKRAFGAVELAKERQRDARSFVWLEQLQQDVRYALRTLRRSPIFTTIAIASLSLGLGATLTAFSLIDGLYLRDLPVRDPSRLVALATTTPRDRPSRLSVPMFDALSRRQRVFSSMFAWWGGGIYTAQVGRDTSPVDVWAVTGNFYAELGTRPQLGRLLQPEDVNLATATSPQVAVLGFGFWQRMFGGSPHVIGKEVRVEGVPFTIVGVAPRGFTGMQIVTEPDVTIPLNAEWLITPETRQAWGSADHLWMTVGGRLKEGVSLEQARAQLDAVWPAVLRATVPPTLTGDRRADFTGLRLHVASAATGQDYYLRQAYRRPLVALIALAALILLVGCLNLAGLMLSRAAARNQELTVRRALGASAWRLARQELIEGILIAGAGTLVGLWLAMRASVLIRDAITSMYVTPAILHVGPDGHVLALAIALTWASGLLCAALPAWHAARKDPARMLPDRSRTVGGGTTRTGRCLMTVQIALSVVLLTGAGLFMRSFERLQVIEPGFRVRDMLDVGLAPMPNGYRHLDKDAYYRQLVERISSVPGVRSACLAHVRPVYFSRWTAIVSAEAGRGRWTPAFESVSPGFFRTMGMHVLGGRTFLWTDNERASGVAVVSQAMARQLAPDGQVIGRRLHLETIPGLHDVTIVGIVNDARLYDVRSRDLRAVYVPFLQVPSLAGWPDVIVHAAPAAGLTHAVRLAVESLGHEYPMGTMTLERAWNGGLLQERMLATLGTFFAGLALLLAAIGLYGLMSYAVTRRTREVGIRMALGCTRRKVVGALLRETLTLVGIGMLVGVPLAVGAGTLMAHLLYGLLPDDPLTLAIVIMMLALTGLIAGYLPARRASRIDPMSALRCE